MKTWFLYFHSVLSLLFACSALGQATFSLDNYEPRQGVSGLVFDAQGAPLEGTNYLAELWGGPTPDSLSPAIVFFEGRREIVPFHTHGYFTSGKSRLSIPSVDGYGWAWLQVRAWDTRLGQTYEVAAARGIGGYGESPIFYAHGGSAWDLNGLPKLLIGLESFSLRPISGVLIHSVRKVDDHIVLEWIGGAK